MAAAGPNEYFVFPEVTSFLALFYTFYHPDF